MARQSTMGIEDVDPLVEGEAAHHAPASDALAEDSASAFDLDPQSAEAEAMPRAERTSREGPEAASTKTSAGSSAPSASLGSSVSANGEESAIGSDVPTEGAREEDEEPKPRLYQLEQPLVDTAAELVAERARFEQLLEAANEGRERVSPEIYERVVEDYQTRLAAVEEKYEPVREEILDHVRSVMQEERSVRQRLEEINEVVEELRFRRQLGEFDDDEFDRRRSESTGELTELDEKLSCIESLYRTVRSLLGHDAQAILQTSSGVSPLSAEQVGEGESVDPASDDSESSRGDPALEKTAVLQVISDEASQSKTVIVAAPGGPYLENIQAPGRAPRVRITPLTPDVDGPVALRDRELVLGRSTTCDVVLQGATVSRRHALMRRNGDVIEIEDISSGGGVLLNGERIERLATVEIGDQIQIGGAVLRVDA